MECPQCKSADMYLENDNTIMCPECLFWLELGENVSEVLKQ